MSLRYLVMQWPHYMFEFTMVSVIGKLNVTETQKISVTRI